jgi:SulP family sulfate permease
VQAQPNREEQPWFSTNICNVAAALMATEQATHFPNEFRGGVESTIHGFSNSIGPILIFGSFFGAISLAAAFWATLVTATVVPAVAWLLKSDPVIHRSSRTASLTAYAALVWQLSLASSGTAVPGAMPSAAQFVTGLAAGSLLFAVASGLVILAGVFKLGHIFKMIPSTVSAGISNSTAFLLLMLAVNQVWGNSWHAGLVTAVMVLVFWLWTRFQQRLAVLYLVPNVLVAVLIGVILTVSMDTFTGAQAPASVQDQSIWMGFGLWQGLLSQAHLSHLLLQGLPGTLTLALVMILESFTTHSVLESRFGLRIHANRELMALGGSNLVSALLGGAPCTSNTIRSVSNRLAGGRGSLALWVGVALSGLAVLLLGNWLLVVPAGIVAGLFLLQAPLMIDPAFKNRLLEMLRQREWQHTGSTDLGFWITFVITLAGIFGNLIWACFMGIGLSCLAVLRRVSGSLTSRWAYLDQYRSRRVRSLSEITVMEQAPRQVGVLQLTGHLFFGNSTRLTQLLDELETDAHAVVLDVSRVHDVDTSGIGALIWLIKALLERHLFVVLTGDRQTPSLDLRQALGSQTGVTFSIDLDRGLEMCEELVLQCAAVAPVKLQSVLPAANILLKELLADDLTVLLMMLESHELAPGDALFHRFDPADGIWLIEAGMVSILSGSGDASRLATFGPGQFVGEMGFVDGQSRSATALADTHLRASFLSHQSLANLARDYPDAALKIGLNIARELSLRMRNTTTRFKGDTSSDATGWANSELLSALSRF